MMGLSGCGSTRQPHGNSHNGAQRFFATFGGSRNHDIIATSQVTKPRRILIGTGWLVSQCEASSAHCAKCDDAFGNRCKASHAHRSPKLKATAAAAQPNRWNRALRLEGSSNQQRAARTCVQPCNAWETMSGGEGNQDGTQKGVGGFRNDGYRSGRRPIPTAKWVPVCGGLLDPIGGVVFQDSVPRARWLCDSDRSGRQRTVARAVGRLEAGRKPLGNMGAGGGANRGIPVPAVASADVGGVITINTKSSNFKHQPIRP